MNASCADALIVPDWPAPPSVRAFVTTRRMPGNSRLPYDALNLGLRNGEDVELVRANRALLTRALELPSAPRFLTQVHGVTAASFDERGAEEREADAAVTRARGVVLAILT